LLELNGSGRRFDLKGSLSPFLRFQEELPGSEYEGKRLFTPPFQEQVPRPELEEYLPLLQMLPAEAVVGANRDPAMNPAVISATNLAFFMDLPFSRDPLLGLSYL